MVSYTIGGILIFWSCLMLFQNHVSHRFDNLELQRFATFDTRFHYRYKLVGYGQDCKPSPAKNYPRRK